MKLSKKVPVLTPDAKMPDARCPVVRTKRS